MKFSKRYEELMKKTKEIQNLPRVEMKRFKKILKVCRKRRQIVVGEEEQELEEDHHERLQAATGIIAAYHVSSNPDSSEYSCPICDSSFFPSLVKDLSAVSICFNKRAKKLLQMHLNSGVRKFFICFCNNFQGDHVGLIEEGKDLVTYAALNTIAIRKLLKKYDKIHHTNQGQAFKVPARKMSIELLKSPWLNELIALYINMKEIKNNTVESPGMLDNCSIKFDEGKPSLSCVLMDSLQIEIDLTCSICLDTVFDAVFLTCGHIFCYLCACSAASVTVVDGLKAAEKHARCPLCRQTGVYNHFVRLEELNILLSRSYPSYWNERLSSERAERVKQAKDYWEAQCRGLTGF